MSEVVQVLQSTRHNGFPVIRHTEPYDEGQLVGLILRHQLLLLLEQRALIEVDSDTLHQPLPQRIIERVPRVTKEHVYLEHAMRVYHHSHYPHKRYLSSLPEALEELELEDILQVGLHLHERPKNYKTNLPFSCLHTSCSISILDASHTVRISVVTGISWLFCRRTQ